MSLTMHGIIESLGFLLDLPWILHWLPLAICKSPARYKPITMILSSSKAKRGNVIFTSDGTDLMEVHILKVRGLNIRAPQNVPSNTDSSVDAPPGGKSDLAKSILEYIFLAVALLIITSIILRRITNLKRRNQPFTSFFHPNHTRATIHHHRHAHGQISSAGIPSPNYNIEPTAYRRDLDVPHLATYPAAYFGHGNRRTHAHDIDANGRRLGHTAFLDHEGELGDKDVLPAYDTYGGPPKYNELELQHRLSSVENGASHPAGNQSSTRITGEGAVPFDERQALLPLSLPSNSNDPENQSTNSRVSPTSTDS